MEMCHRGEAGEVPDGQIQTACFASNTLHLVLLPTEQCNFRCTYCYETFHNKKMAAPVVAGVKALIDHRAEELDILELGWFGGEPLLALDIIEDISRHAIARGAERNFALGASITTNGYFLDPANFRRCLDSRITGYQISLDGAEELHDKSRMLASGAGTFRRIWSNLVQMKAVQAEFIAVLRLHYNPENYKELARFGRTVREEFGDDKRFAVLFKAVERLGGPNDSAIAKMSREQRDEIEDYLADQSGIRNRYEIPRKYVCYAGKGNSLVIRSTGGIAKCTVALHSDFNDIGTLRPDGYIDADQTKFRRWMAPVLEGRWKDAQCPVASVGQAAARERSPASLRPTAPA
ncbi:MAG TPA: radical SAM protein [Rhizomicrobium sp.]